MRNQPKSLSIETLRGIAIILVVIGHVIGSKSSGGMQVEDDSIYRYLYCLLENIRMPLFTVISGWVYALHPVRMDAIRPFVGKKARRLLLPMIFVGTTYFILQNIIPGTNHKEAIQDIWKVYIYPYTFFWYLPALFLVFSGVVLLEITNSLNTVKKWLFALLLAWVFCFCELSHIIPIEIPNFFAFKNALYLSPFFILGIGLTRFKEVVYTKSMIIVYALGTTLGVIFQQINYFSGIAFYESMHLSVIIGLFATALIMYSKLQLSFFVRIAQYAYTIYLFHGFGTSGGRIILKKLHVHNEFIIFIFATVIALFLPILVEKLFVKVKILRVLFLGKK